MRSSIMYQKICNDRKMHVIQKFVTRDTEVRNFDRDDLIITQSLLGRPGLS